MKEKDAGSNNDAAVLAWKKICQKEFKSLIYFEIVTAIFFVVMLCMKLANRDAITINFIYLLASCFFAASSISMVFMLVEKSMFLKNENVNLYTDYILHHAVMDTPTELITKRFIFKKLRITKPIDFENVKSAYKVTIVSNYSTPDRIVICMEDGKKMKMNFRNSFSDNDLNRLVKQYKEKAKTPEVSTLVRVISEYHAPIYYDSISDYDFLYEKNGVFFVVRYHYYNGYVDFCTLKVPDSLKDDVERFAKENKNLFGEQIKVMDNFERYINCLPVDERAKARLYREQRSPETIELLLKAYELSGKSLL